MKIYNQKKGFRNRPHSKTLSEAEYRVEET